jgi:cell wall-associated NlpC family hydrolase
VHRLSPRVRVLIVLIAGLGLLMAAMVSVPLMMLMGSTAVSSTSGSGDDTACGPVATAGGRTFTLDAEQLANAKTVVNTGRALKVPNRGLVVAVAAALQESTLQNLTWGDRDSVGLFQQRAGWGSVSARTDPPTAAAMFYTGGSAGQPGLIDVAGWATMSIGAAAQSVQRSAFPTAYDQWEALARSLVQSVIGNDPLGCTQALNASLPTGAIGKMLTTALAQQGDPYVWGAVGPDAFDCSGLVIYSWGQAGYRVTVRTAAQMYVNSTPVAAGSEQPGDLLFGEFRANGANHVMIVVRPGVAVEAPETGRNVEVIDYSSRSTGWRLARLNSSVLEPISVGT